MGLGMANMSNRRAGALDCTIGNPIEPGANHAIERPARGHHFGACLCFNDLVDQRVDRRVGYACEVVRSLGGRRLDVKLERNVSPGVLDMLNRIDVTSKLKSSTRARYCTGSTSRTVDRCQASQGS